MKKWWASKTVWVNALTLLVGVVGYIAGHDVIQSNPGLIAILIAAQGGVNVILRFVTGKSLSG
jgi:hypothetical protein